MKAFLDKVECSDDEKKALLALDKKLISKIYEILFFSSPIGFGIDDDKKNTFKIGVTEEVFKRNWPDKKFDDTQDTISVIISHNVRMGGSDIGVVIIKVDEDRYFMKYLDNKLNKNQQAYFYPLNGGIEILYFNYNYSELPEPKNFANEFDSSLKGEALDKKMNDEYKKHDTKRRSILSKRERKFK